MFIFKKLGFGITLNIKNLSIKVFNRGKQKNCLHIWVVGSPRSGTTYLTKLVGANTDLMFNEPSKIPMYSRDNVERWKFESGKSVTFKWCENWRNAEQILARFPNSLFLHSIRDPLNNMYSMAFPKQDSLPPRPFKQFGDEPSTRIDKAIGKWSNYTKGCLSLSDTVKDRYLVVPYENMPAHIIRIEKLSSLKISDILPHQNRNLPDSELEQIKEAISKNSFAQQLMETAIERVELANLDLANQSMSL